MKMWKCAGLFLRSFLLPFSSEIDCDTVLSCADAANLVDLDVGDGQAKDGVLGGDDAAANMGLAEGNLACVAVLGAVSNSLCEALYDLLRGEGVGVALVKEGLKAEGDGLATRLLAVVDPIESQGAGNTISGGKVGVLDGKVDDDSSSNIESDSWLVGVASGQVLLAGVVDRGQQWSALGGEKVIDGVVWAKDVGVGVVGVVDSDGVQATEDWDSCKIDGVGGGIGNVAKGDHCITTGDRYLTTRYLTLVALLDG